MPQCIEMTFDRFMAQPQDAREETFARMGRPPALCLSGHFFECPRHQPCQPGLDIRGPAVVRGRVELRDDRSALVLGDRQGGQEAANEAYGGVAGFDQFPLEGSYP